MNAFTPSCFIAVTLLSTASSRCFCSTAEAQVPAEILPAFAVPTTPQAQRQAMSNVGVRVTWLKNATRTAPTYASGGEGLVWRSLQALRLEFGSFTKTLTPRQQADGANELAELAAGLDILEQALTNYYQDVAAGRLATQALREMCQVLARGADIWLAEFNKDCTRLRIGR